MPFWAGHVDKQFAMWMCRNFSSMCSFFPSVAAVEFQEFSGLFTILIKIEDIELDSSVR